MNCFTFLLLFVMTIAICQAKVVSSDNSNAIEPSEKSTNASSLVATEKISHSSVPALHQYLPTDLSSKSGVGQALLVGGAVIVSLFVLGGLALFLTPAFGYKLCQIFGTCDYYATSYSSNGAPINAAQPNSAYNDLYGAFVPAGYTNYQKRSLDYVGPILKTLVSAYEKYGSQQPVMNKKTE